MNANNIYNQNEVKNKLQNFQEGKDYFVTPTKEPKIKDYTFFNECLKSLFGGNNWIPVRVWQEKYEDKNVSYRGHFEEGKDYKYSAQSWVYDKNYQGDRGTEGMSELWKNIDWDERSEIEYRAGAGSADKNGKVLWEKSWTFSDERYKHTWIFRGGEVEKHRNSLGEFEEKRRLLKDKIEWLSKQPKGQENEKELRELESKLVEVNHKIRYHENWLAQNANSQSPSGEDKHPHGGVVERGSKYNGSPQQKGRIGRFSNEQGNWVANDNSDLAKQNHQLRQQLAAVQVELAKALVELKKLTGKTETLNKLEQQQAQNEKAMKNGSPVEMKQQVANSQALVQGASSANATVSKNQKEPKSGMLPYVVVGSLLVAGVVGGAVAWMKKTRKK